MLEEQRSELLRSNILRMVVNSTAENALGTVGAVLWCVQLLPQILKSWRAKSTSGLSPWLMLTWTVSMGLLATYNITQRLSIPLHVQPELCGMRRFFRPIICEFTHRHTSVLLGRTFVCYLLGAMLVLRSWCSQGSMHCVHSRILLHLGCSASGLCLRVKSECLGGDVVFAIFSSFIRTGRYSQ